MKSIKTTLKVTLWERILTDEVFMTLLSEAEAGVNARPLSHVSTDPAEPEALTSMHILLGSSSGRRRDLCSRSGCRRAVRLADFFWWRWVSEYLPTLAPRRVQGSDIPIETPCSSPMETPREVHGLGHHSRHVPWPRRTCTCRRHTYRWRDLASNS